MTTTDIPGADKEKVNHPPHYKKHPSGVECIQITEHMNFNLGNCVKYIWRHGEKGHATEDLKKAAWYLQREIERLEGATPVETRVWPNHNETVHTPNPSMSMPLYPPEIT